MGLMDALIGSGAAEQIFGTVDDQRDASRYATMSNQQLAAQGIAAQGAYAAAQNQARGMHGSIYQTALQGSQISIDKEFNPNELPEYQMSLSALADLWVAKFGDVWVNFSNVRSDNFWDNASHRLIQAGRMETVDARSWMRIKER